MRWFYIELRCQNVPRDVLENQFEPIADALADHPGDVDADLGTDLAAGTLDFQLSARADEPPGALTQALAVVRSALHTARAASAECAQLAGLVDRAEVIATVRPSDLEPVGP